MKKIISILLLLIIVLSSFSQCCLYDDCAQEFLSKTIPQSDDDTDQGSCSPFSSCTTCFGFTANVELVKVTAPAVIDNKHEAIEHTPSLSSMLSSFWQPPRVQTTLF